jgi:uncharacterized membrane protein YcaP (DUF421 family)
MDWLIGGWQHIGGIAAKAFLMYATAVLALRVSERRTLAQWTIIDIATAVGIGAIIGRTAVAHDQSYVSGATALVTLVAAHHVASVVRMRPRLRNLFDHRPRVLVVHGTVRRRELHRCALTDEDLFAHLRERGVFQLAEVALVLYEPKGTLTVVLERDAQAAADLVEAGLRNSVGFGPPSAS